MNRSLSRPTLALVILLSALLATAGCEDGPSIEDARDLQSKGRFEASIEPLRLLLDENPDDPEIYYLYGVALNRTTSSPVAVWALTKAAEDPEWTVRALLELATGHMQISNWDEVISATTRVLEVEPDNLAALGLRGMAHLGDEESADLALEDFEQMLDLAPDDSGAQVSRAAALLLLGEVEAAEEALAEIVAVTADANAPGAQAMLCTTGAVLLWEKQEIEAATERFEACLADYPRDGLLLDQAMSFFDAQEDRERATALLEAALLAAPMDPGSRSRLASRFEADGDLERAESVLREGTQLPNPVAQSAAWVDLTNFMLERDNLDGAIEAYHEALELTSDPSQLAILTYADLLARAERNEEALVFAERLTRKSYRALVEARVHLNQHRPAKALASLEEVFPTWPNNAGARYYAARAAEQLGDFSRAIEEYRQSIRSAADQTDAGLRLAKLYLAAGSLQNAWNHGIQHFRANPKDPEAIRVLLRAATSADSKSVTTLFRGLRGGPLFPTAVAIRAGLIAESEGIDAALGFFKETEELDLTLPENVEALRVRVDLEIAAGQADRARNLAEAAIKAHPEAAGFHEIMGRVSEGQNASPQEILAAYQRATELSPGDSAALESLGRFHARAGRVDEAVALLTRASEADPYADSPGRIAALALEGAGRLDAAQKHWDEHLREHPWDAAAALAWNRLRLANGQHDDFTLQLAERAVLFQGGPEAQQRLIDTHRARGDKNRVLELEQAMNERKPLAPLRVTPIDGA